MTHVRTALMFFIAALLGVLVGNIYLKSDEAPSDGSLGETESSRLQPHDVSNSASQVGLQRPARPPRLLPSNVATSGHRVDRPGSVHTGPNNVRLIAGSDLQFDVVEFVDGSNKVSWRPGKGPVRLQGKSLKLQGMATADFDQAKLVAMVDAKEYKLLPTQKGKSFTFQIDNLSARSHLLTLKYDGENVGPTTRIDVPGDAIKSVEVKASSHRHADTPSNQQGPASAYNGFLKLFGPPITGATRISLLLVDSNNGMQQEVNLRQPVVAVSNSKWTGEVVLPQFPRNGKLYVVAIGPGGHQFANAPIKYERFESTKLPKPTDLQAGSINGASFTALKQHRNYLVTNVADVVLRGTVDVPNPNVADLLVVRDGTTIIESTASTGLTDPTGTKSLKVTLPRPGRYTLQLAVMQGSDNRALSEPVVIDYRTDGPKVLAVDDASFRFNRHVNSIGVQFDPARPIDASGDLKSHFELKNTTPLAQQLANAGNADDDKGAVATAVRGIIKGLTIKPTEATLDETTNAVTLQFPEIAAGSYELTVKTTIKDVYGTTLQAAYTESIVKSVIDTPPSGTPRGISGMTGKFVRYREFTDPRSVPDGFNPSDKVVTQTVRLYYFRDAHRVAQLVNRKARSYNRQGVDMQRQVADKARSVAEGLTAKRRGLERRAVRSAEAARLAEHQMADAQAKLNQARTGAAQTARTAAQLGTTVETLRTTELRMAQEQSRAQSEVDRIDGVLKSLGMDADPQKKADLEASLQEARAKLIDVEARLAAARKQLQIAQEQAAAANTAANTAQSRLNDVQSTLGAAQATLQSARTEEIRLAEQAEQATSREELAIKEQFRREVAAAHADPDTFAPGEPKSNDPVEQVSLSVIGEGLIQLRGPRKGVNLIRTQINQIDAPAGQVRVALHTVQVNGERGDRMEIVARRIQRYIDHSRFLTTRSGQMLRNAVVLVASRRAEQVAAECPFGSQDARDQKYLTAFFGKDFIDELRTLDSEFLKTGNKLLSLHSMDTTSLASALFLLSLAKNDVRQEIIREFECMVQERLPQEELDYFTAGGAEERYGCKRNKFTFLAHNAKFVSFKGFFTHQVIGPNTLTPLQREFIRLAQIFKSRLVTEIEFKQRVMQRSLIEQRLGDYAKQLRESRDKELEARRALEEAQKAMSTAQIRVVQASTMLAAEAEAIRRSVTTSMRWASGPYDWIYVLNSGRTRTTAVRPPLATSTRGMTYQELRKRIENRLTDRANALRLSRPTNENKAENGAGEPYDLRVTENGREVHIKVIVKGGSVYVCDTEHRTVFVEALKEVIAKVERGWKAVRRFNLNTDEERRRFDLAQRAFREIEEVRKSLNKQPANKTDVLTLAKLETIGVCYDNVVNILNHISDTTGRFESGVREVAGDLSEDPREFQNAQAKWIALRDEHKPLLRDPGLKKLADLRFGAVDAGFNDMLTAVVKSQLAEQNLERSLQPLDHKKFLDMLIDDVEEKYIELVEGTRAHTANIDNYVKRLATALEDDFNTQFYYPAFREIRKTSQFWDVSLGQVETTSILTNNRMFAKVSPQATMEFDLPKRDIVIQEAMSAARAAYSDYGALLGDPNFLTLTKMYSGQSTSSAFNSGAPNPLVRDVLPGLPSSSNESLLAQGSGRQPQFASQLEALVPDPAIYKFETGTGFEIRPVIQPDGQAVVFHLNYMYTTNVREPVRADEKHLGRIKRHFIDTDVQTGNYELREVSRYQVALKASRTARGVPLLEDVPGLGVLFRPLPQQESSLQQNLILAQSVIYPTLFDLMGLRWAPAVADLDALRLTETDFVTRSRQRTLRNRVFDFSSRQVDQFLRIPEAERRGDLYRSQETIPRVHPNGYQGPGMNLQESRMREGYRPSHVRPETRYVPGTSKEGAIGQPMYAPPSGGNSHGGSATMKPLPQKKNNDGASLPLPGSRPSPSYAPGYAPKRFVQPASTMRPATRVQRKIPLSQRIRLLPQRSHRQDVGRVVPAAHEQPAPKRTHRWKLPFTRR